MSSDDIKRVQERIQHIQIWEKTVSKSCLERASLNYPLGFL